MAPEWKGEDFLLKSYDVTDLPQLTISGSGAISHPEAGHGARGYAQLRIEIPLTKGITLPLSLSYASSSDSSGKSEVRGDFGIAMDWDKLFDSMSRYSPGV